MIFGVRCPSPLATNAKLITTPPSGGIVSDFLQSENAAPYDYAVVSDLIGALTVEENDVLNDLNGGVSPKGICERESITTIRLNSLHKFVQEKAQREGK